MVHVMITDTADAADRAQFFLYLHGADVLSGFFGPAISAPLMEKGYTSIVLLLAEGILFFGAFVLSSFIPETQTVCSKSLDESEPICDEVTTKNHSKTSGGSARALSLWALASSMKRLQAGVSHLVKPLRLVLTSSPQAILLLSIFAPQTAARKLFNMIGLQYLNSKYSISYARGKVLLSIFQAAQGVFVFVILPCITRGLAGRRG